MLRTIINSVYLQEKPTMKLLLSITLLTPVLAFSQITITESDFSDAGDTALVSLAADLTIDYASTGTNFTWDFSNLTHLSQEVKEYNQVSSASMLVGMVFGTFASPAYQATNFAASTSIPLDQIGTFLPVNISDVSLFSKNSAASINSVGYGVTVDGFEVPFKSDTIETRYELPLNYGDTYSSRGYSNLDMNPVYNAIWRQYRQRSSVVDGWGTITTPYGTFDALRIDHTITEVDSIYIDAIVSGFWLELPIPPSHDYEWWTSGEKEPILKITVSTILGADVVTSIEYRDIDRYVGLEEVSMNLKVYPNPTTDVLTVEGDFVDAKYSIVDSKGSVLKTGILSTSSSTIQVADLPVGGYQFVLSVQGSQSTQLFIKK